MKPENGRLKLLLENVRVGGHSFYKASAFDKDDDPKFSGSFIMDKDSDAAKKAKAGIMAMAVDKWGEAGKQTCKALFAGDKVCLHDGALKADKEGYGEERYYLNASNKARPTLLDRSRNATTEADSILYPGCYVNVIVELWAQDNKWGKRVNAELKGVQFVGDGDRLGGGAPATADDFPELDDEGTEGGDWNEAEDTDWA